MALALQQLINGLTLGAVYGLIAIGYTMVYGIIGMINFAHGDIYMVSAFIAVTAFTLLAALGVTSVPLALATVLLISVVFTSVYGWAVERTAYRPLRGSMRLAPLISAIGMSIFLQNMVQLTQGARVKPIPPVLVGGFDLLTSADGFTVHLSYSQLLIVLVTVYYGVVDFYIGFVAGIKAFTAAVLGGIGSMPGAMLGGLIIGMIEAFWAAYLSPEYKDVATFSILILVLMFRPAGLLGRPEVEKV